MHRAAALAALALAACTTDSGPPAPSPSASPTPAVPPDEPLLLAALARTEHLVRLYAGSPAAAGLRPHLARHREALRARLATPPTPAPAETRPVPQPLPRIVEAVRKISRDDVTAAGRASDPAHALLLAEIGASRVQHAVLLGRSR